MRYIYNYLMIISLLLISCNESNPLMESTLPVEIITDALSEYTVSPEPADGFSIEFTVEDPLNSEIKSDQDWCKVVTEIDNGVRVKLVIGDNEVNRDRIAQVVISSPQIKGEYMILVTQRASVFEIMDLGNIFAPEGGVFPVLVNSNISWTLESDEDWIEFDVDFGESTEESDPIAVNIIVEPNEDGIVRSANLLLKSASGKRFTQKVLQNEPWITDVRIGDVGVKFDESRFDSDYPQMLEWQKAGRSEGAAKAAVGSVSLMGLAGIPSIESQLSDVFVEFGPETPISEIKAFFAPTNYGERNIFFKNGVYNLDEVIRLWPRDVLIGESRDGVIIKLSGDARLNLYNGHNIGIRNLTIEGNWSNQSPDPSNMSETLSGKGNHAVIDMNLTKFSYVDDVKIINSASIPISIAGDVKTNNNGAYNTIRDVEIDGAYNKGNNQGVLRIRGSYNLITGCKVANLRHISFEEKTSYYNVFYKNDVAQDVSFVKEDGGNNLVENNRITLPKTLPGNYVSIMGPWGSNKIGGKNFVYRNKCLELNRGSYTPWSDNELYVGPWEASPSDAYTNFRVTSDNLNPKGEILYPIVLK